MTANFKAAPNKPAKAPRKKAGPKKVTLKYLENAALYYLQRYAASAANLRAVLLRKVERSAYEHDTDVDQGAAWVEDIIARYLQTGLLDDAAFARLKSTAMHRRGTSARMIRGKLGAAGVDPDTIDAALTEHATEHPNPDLAAACTFARRRRLGPYRDEPLRSERHQKDLAALARAGFAFELAQRVVDAETVEDLEDLARGDD